MGRSTRFAMALTLASSLAGCKLAVIVVEGGEVQSDSFSTCFSGAVCIREIDDANYLETLTAVPDPGWVFVGWNKCKNFLCSDNLSDNCELTTIGTSGFKLIEDIIASNETFYVMPIFVEADLPDTLVVDGKIWKQPAAFTNLSWHDIDAVCPLASDGDCEGTLNGTDVSDWRWASVSDLRSMLNTYGAAIPSDEVYIEETGSSWAPALFSAGWQPTYTSGIEIGLSGWTRGEGFDATQGTFSGMDQSPAGGSDYAYAGISEPKTTTQTSIGAWFYYSP